MSSSDERAWRERLATHIESYITAARPSSLAARSSSPELLSQALRALHSLCGALPVEYGLLSVGEVCENFSLSFRVVLHGGCLLGEGKSPSGSAESASRLLPAMPLVLIGVLRPGGCHGDVVIADSSGEIPCKIATCCLSAALTAMGQVVLLTSWNFIHSPTKSSSYLEISNLSSIASDPAPPPSSSSVMSVSRLLGALRSKSCPQHRRSVCGTVKAVSEPLRNGSEFLSIVQLADSVDVTATIDIFILSQCALACVGLLEVSTGCVLTELKEMLMREERGQPQSRIMATTSNSRLFSAEGLATSSPEHLSPPCKRIRRKEEEEEGGEVASSWEALTQERTPALQTLVSYQGVVTRTVLAEAGVYELDGRILLYLTHCPSPSVSRGVRPGATLRLANVHVLRPDDPRFRAAASGFYLCPYSSLRVLRFSPTNCGYQAFHPQGRLASLARSLCASDVAWMVRSHSSLPSSSSPHGSLQLLKALVSRSNAPPLKLKPTTNFRRHPHACPQMLNTDLSSRPSLPNLQTFITEVTEMLSSFSVSSLDVASRWTCGEGLNSVGDGGGGGGGGGRGVAYTVPVQWWFATVKSSQLSTPQVLVGTLTSSTATGYLQLSDSTASIPLLLCLPPSPSASTFPRLGSTLLLQTFTLLAERTVQAGDPPSLSLCLTSEDVSSYPAAASGAVKKESAKQAAPLPKTAVTRCKNDGSLSTAELNFPVRAKPVADRKSFTAHTPRSLYVRVVNKNAPTITKPSSSSSSCRHQCGFAAHCLLHSDLSTLRHSSTLLPPTTRHTAGKKSEQEEGEGEGEGWSEPPLKAVLDFPPSAFRWHSYIRNGCVYSLSCKLSPLLSSLEALRKVPCIQVTDDVSFELIGSLSPERRDITCVADVAEILSKFHLPKLSTAGKTEPKDNQRSEVAELVTFRGVILKHGYRIDHESLSSSTSSSSSHPSHLHPSPSSPLTNTTAAPVSNINVLNVRSVKHPDTISVYCSFKQQIPQPLGLLPGALATFNSFKLKTSKSGNLYATSCASSSVDVDSLSGVCVEFVELQKSSNVTLEMLSLPSRYLGDLMVELVEGRLGRGVVCVGGRVVTVLHVAVQYKCLGCQAVAVRGKCLTSCPARQHVLRVDARLLVGDGTGEGHLYASDDLVRQVLAVGVAEWDRFCEDVSKLGQLIYTKSSALIRELQSAAGKERGAGLQERALCSLYQFLSRPSVHRRVLLYCQPFVSLPELRECVLGQKTRMVNIAGTKHSTLALPRLQLKCLAVQSPVNCVRESGKLLAQLTGSEEEEEGHW